MIHTDILIVGAGACGLMAAKELSASGKKVFLLEARKRAGGRINTLPAKQFSQPAEAGAEFIHGNLPVTLQLLQEYRINYTKIEGSMMRRTNGKWHHSHEEVEGWDKMMRQMNKLASDMTLADFLNTFFGEEKYAALRQSATGFAQGFDVADENNASVLALRNEWQHEEEEQYRIPGGYMQLVDALTGVCLQQHCEIHFSEEVNKVVWSKDKAVVTTTNNEQFSAGKIIITIPVGVLQNEQTVTFEPAIKDKINAAGQIGFGSVIKVLLEFEEAFWTDLKKNVSFFFSDETIPVWWTQYPAKTKLLTGWLGGPKSLQLNDYSPEQIKDVALQSLSNMFGKALSPVTAWHVANWHTEAYTGGAYSYNTLQSKEAKAVLQMPVENTIYFAGEALYTGEAQGTVEAALVSGKEVAEQLLNK